VHDEIRLVNSLQGRLCFLKNERFLAAVPLSTEDLTVLADELRRRRAVRSRVLSKLILGEARKQGGFRLGNVWRNEKLHRYSFREILARCKELEDQGRLRWLPDGTYVPAAHSQADTGKTQTEKRSGSG